MARSCDRTASHGNKDRLLWPESKLLKNYKQMSFDGLDSVVLWFLPLLQGPGH